MELHDPEALEEGGSAAMCSRGVGQGGCCCHGCSIPEGAIVGQSAGPPSNESGCAVWQPLNAATMISRAKQFGFCFPTPAVELPARLSAEPVLGFNRSMQAIAPNDLSLSILSSSCLCEAKAKKGTPPECNIPPPRGPLALGLRAKSICVSVVSSHALLARLDTLRARLRRNRLSGRA